VSVSFDRQHIFSCLPSQQISIPSIRRPDVSLNWARMTAPDGLPALHHGRHHCQERTVVIDTILNMMNDPVQQWVVFAAILVLLGPLEFLIVRFLWSLPKAQRRTLIMIVLAVIFFPLIFLFLALTADPDD
jgi:hypothetical protein